MSTVDKYKEVAGKTESLCQAFYAANQAQLDNREPSMCDVISPLDEAREALEKAKRVASLAGLNPSEASLKAQFSAYIKYYDEQLQDYIADLAWEDVNITAQDIQSAHIDPQDRTAENKQICEDAGAPFMAEIFTP